MSKATLNYGAAPDDGTGDTGRSGAIKIQANFDELYTFLGGSTLSLPSTRIPYGDGSGFHTSSANLIFDGTTFSTLRGLFAAGTMTSNGNPLLVTQTRNASGVTFDGAIKAVITDTASAAGSLAMQILGGASGTTNLFSVTKGGNVNLGGTTLTGPSYLELYGTGGNAVIIGLNSSARQMAFLSGKVGVGSAQVFGFSSATDPVTANPDTAFARVSAAVVEVNNGTAGTIGTIRSKYQSSDGTAGVTSFGPGAVTSITIKDGLVVAIS